MKQKDFKSWNSLKEQLHNDKINFRYRDCYPFGKSKGCARWRFVDVSY